MRRRQTAEETALFIAALLKRSGQRRARVSEKTIRVLSSRRTLRDAFKERLRSELDDLGVHLVQLERGGFGIIPINSLDGAPTVTAKKFLMEELTEVRNGKKDAVLDRLRSEVAADTDYDSDE